MLKKKVSITFFYISSKSRTHKRKTVLERGKSKIWKKKEPWGRNSILKRAFLQFVILPCVGFEPNIIVSVYVPIKAYVSIFSVIRFFTFEPLSILMSTSPFLKIAARHCRNGKFPKNGERKKISRTISEKILKNLENHCCLPTFDTSLYTITTKCSHARLCSN